MRRTYILIGALVGLAPLLGSCVVLEIGSGGLPYEDVMLQKEIRMMSEISPEARRAIEKATSCPKREAPNASDGLSDEALLALFLETPLPGDPPAELRDNTDADDEFAVAGTWRYDNEIGGGRINGTFIVQVVNGQIEAVHGFSGEEYNCMLSF